MQLKIKKYKNIRNVKDEKKNNIWEKIYGNKKLEMLR